ncbi:LuxR C-terminal-related transcriptional regulator [Xanthomarina sp. F2636L]|uniref:LuxR C-terminal-related transcriptional regulator n=1 Tax=Xanthomarina sp. F2636L TaxID=2996018 RepID=UPI00225E51D8|nr:LuxR C-terminal-related transcriptional regulator [Xanthomarina sp. F2636L]MCX7550480.1 LuxR C-terminal-related transcriptional regulator [Xanthomarina sp. F2636L]
MICLPLNHILKKSAYILLLSVSTCIFSQDNNTRVQEALKQFETTQNPNDGIKNLLSLKELVPQTTDSLQGYYYMNLGIAYGQLNQADSSFWYLDKAEKIANNTQSDFLLAMINNTRGLVYMGKAEYEASLAAYQEVMKLAEGKNDKRLNDVLSKTYGNLGGVYFQLGQMDKALETTKKCLELSETLNDTTDIALNHLRLAMVYNNIDQLDNGIHHLNQARTFFKDLNDTTMLVYAENSLGKVFQKKGALESAYNHYYTAHNLAKTLGEQEEYVLTLLAMSNIRLEQLQLQSAETFAQQALMFSKDKGYADSEKKAYNLLYQIALQNNQTKQALDYRNAYIILTDSLNSVEVKARVADLETKYETTKKEKEIQELTFESELKDANLAKARSMQIALITGAIGVIIILIIVFYSRQKKLKAEREAQALQVEALQKRFLELHSSPSELSVDLDMETLNKKLHTPLTEREFEALELCVSGKTNTAIADALFVSVSTVKFHLRNAYSKLGVNNRKEAFQFMLKSV